MACPWYFPVSLRECQRHWVPVSHLPHPDLGLYLSGKGPMQKLSLEGLLCWTVPNLSSSEGERWAPRLHSHTAVHTVSSREKRRSYYFNWEIDRNGCWLTVSSRTWGRIRFRPSHRNEDDRPGSVCKLVATDLGFVSGGGLCSEFRE